MIVLGADEAGTVAPRGPRDADEDRPDARRPESPSQTGASNGALGETRPIDGEVRGVILSEQGFHTPDYSDASQRLQAAAFVYTWHKLRGLKIIEAFHNHRWVDHPQEGGLKLGVRTLPTDGKPYGDQKFAWEIYQALDTLDEAVKTEFAKEIIGVKTFDELR